MFKLFYSINEVFISQLGYYKDNSLVLTYPGTYCIIEKKGNKYRQIFEFDPLLYPCFDKSTPEEKEKSCMWVRVDSIYPYLTEKELSNKKVNVCRLYEIYGTKNGFIVDKSVKSRKLNNVIPFRPAR